MKVYIAARYRWDKPVEINSLIKEMKIDTFLPRDINIDADSREEQACVRDICLHQILHECNVILFIYPFGMNVTYETGVAGAKKAFGLKCQVLLLNLSDEVPCKPEKKMMVADMDKIFTDVPSLLCYLKKLQAEGW